MAQRKQVLIVEDNELNRAMLNAILSEEYRVLEAENGQEALELLQHHRDDISLILLDVMMPVMDGYTFLDRIKDDAELALIPVIVMTQGSSEEDEVSALSHGATDFVPKPYRPQVILHRVASIIRLRETAAMVNQFQYDRLTGLYSKDFFYQKVREVLDENPDEEYAIVCSNIENFKLYNDTFGREAGDRLLQESAERARSELGESCICGRYGADRFMCLKVWDHKDAGWEHFLESIRTYRPKKIDKVSIKWGIYEIKNRSLSVEQMCDRALLAVDSIKGQYNQTLAAYDDTLRGKLLREKAITDAMETALEQEQFVVYLQPKYSLSENCMAGAEALVRWIHPDWGFMSPGEFIPLFEKNGFIPRLDEYVWEQACKLLQDWKERGIPALPISVNVSRTDVYQSLLVDTLLRLTQKYGVDPAYLHLEITESAYAENTTQIINTVAELRKLGFIIEMDDFGSGYSSLNMLSQMKLNILKLDMEFIRNEIVKPTCQSVLNDIISMAHRMGLSVVAEGVETQEQAERLRELECDYAQGYYFAKPMPVAEYETLLTEQLARDVARSQPTLRQKPIVNCILVADEDPEYRRKVGCIFTDEYQVLEAPDADRAMALVAEYGAERISAVILSMTLPGEDAAAVLKLLREDPNYWDIPVLATILSGELADQTPLALKTEDFLCKCHPLFDLRRRVRRLTDIAALRRRERTLKEEASRDAMTALLNRRGLQAAMSSLRTEDLPLAVCLFDLDDLKKVNDSYGHETGDQMISSFADLLRSRTRAGDILCRYGGDEFVVILKRMADETAAVNKALDICRAFRDNSVAEKHQSSCSAGIALCGMDGTPTAKLIDQADQALYHAKRVNKGGCCLWNEEIRMESLQNETE